jgi:hypothetical protein
MSRGFTACWLAWPERHSNGRTAGLECTLLSPVTRRCRRAACGRHRLYRPATQDLFKLVLVRTALQYMSAGLPILFAIDTIHDRSPGPLLIPAEDPPALADVLPHRSTTRRSLRIMGERGRQYVQRTHSYEVLAQQYARLF